MLKLEVPGDPTKVLLHCCCAPCSGAILECMVQQGIRPVIFFSNSNIWPHEEYELRKAEIIRYAAGFGLDVVDDTYDHGEWLDAGTCGAKIREMGAMPERGARCAECFRFRLMRAARYASAHGLEVLTTTLASSRWKDLGQVGEAGRWACSQVSGVEFWDQNWRKGGLQPRRDEIIREQGFYNQNFCGCEFSKQ